MGMLDGKTAIVSGAGRGIGREEALLLAAEGAKVIVNDIGASRAGEGADVHPAEQTVQDIISAGGEAALNTDDVSSWAGAEALVDQAVNSWGKLDILVNNAGILRDKMSFNMDESDWDDTIRVHLKGHFALSHFAAIHWRNRAKAGEEVSGRIINTASEAGLFGNAGQANYGAAKAGIAAMTIILGRELERYGVTVNAISPRARTRMTEDLFGEMAKAEEGKFDAFAPENVAPLVVFLASDEAADINGQNFVVFGGSVWVMQGWQPAGQLKRDTALDPQGAGRQQVDALRHAAPRACRPSPSSRDPTRRPWDWTGLGRSRAPCGRCAGAVVPGGYRVAEHAVARGARVGLIARDHAALQATLDSLGGNRAGAVAVADVADRTQLEGALAELTGGAGAGRHPRQQRRPGSGRPGHGGAGRGHGAGHGHQLPGHRVRHQGPSARHAPASPRPHRQRGLGGGPLRRPGRSRLLRHQIRRGGFHPVARPRAARHGRGSVPLVDPGPVDTGVPRGGADYQRGWPRQGSRVRS